MARAENPEEVQARIFNSFLRTANEGDMNAQFIVGHRYEVGNGIAQDKEKAFYWYSRAAEAGHPLAKLKIEEQKRAKAPAAHEAEARPIRSAPPVAKPAKPAPVPVKAVREVRKAEVKEAKESKPSAERAVDTLQVVLAGQWLQDRQPAEYLPSAKASCLQANDTDVVCFSQELSRVVNDATFTYTVKASLSNFTKDGRFSVNYLYHVADIHRDSEAWGARQAQVGQTEFLNKLGWQEPGHRLDCRAADDDHITCMNNKKQVQFSKK